MDSFDFNPFLDHCCKGRHKQITAPNGTLAIAYAGCPDTPTIQETVDKLVAASGGVVYLPPGYTETTTVPIVTPTSNIAIICPTCDAIITDGSAGGINMITTGANNYGTLYGIKFVGLGAGKTSTGVGGSATCSDWVIERCWFHDCKYGINTFRMNRSTIRDCLATGYATYFILSSRFGTHIRIIDCIADSASITAFAHIPEWPNGLELRGCRALNTAYGFYFLNIRYYQDYPITLTDCHAWNCGSHGFYLAQASDPIPVLLNGCSAIRCRGNGFYIFGGAHGWMSAQFHNCLAVDNSYGNTGVYSGFRIGNKTEYVQLIGCSGFEEWYNQQKYGFQIDAGAVKCEVRGGRWSPNQTGAYLDGGTDSIIKIRPD